MTAADAPPLLHARNLACRRGGRLLFSGLNIALGAGQAALVTGPNGIGKSSLLRLLCGLLPAYAGTLDAAGAFSLADDRLALDADRPLHDALDFWARLDGADADRLSAAMAAVNLTSLADVPVRMLSTGQRKRAVLARTVASGAAIWLLDEPANGLDQASIALLGNAVSAHLASGGAVLAASHQPLPWPHDHVLTIERPADDRDEDMLDIDDSAGETGL